MRHRLLMLLAIPLLVVGVAFGDTPQALEEEYNREEAPPPSGVAWDLQQAFAAYVDSVVAARCDTTGGGEPPDPPDPPPTGGCKDGSDPLTGAWNSFCGDQEQNFSTDPSGYGRMKSNADASRWLRADRSAMASGTVEWEFALAVDRIPEGVAGLHLGGVRSANKYDVGRTEAAKSQLRPDITWRKVDGVFKFRVHTYNADENGMKWANDIVVDVWQTPCPLPAPNAWGKVRFQWRRESSTVVWYKLTAGGKSAERRVTIHPRSKNMESFVVGNIDHLDEFGGAGRFLFRGLLVNP